MRLGRPDRVVRKSNHRSSRFAGRRIRLRRIRKTRTWRKARRSAARSVVLVGCARRNLARLFDSTYSAPMIRLAALVAVALLLIGGACVVAQDWPQFLGPSRNGVYAGTNIAKTWPAEGPPIRWKRKVGQGFSAPVAASNKVILFHRLAGKETIECMDMEKGGTLWSSGYPTSYQDDFGFDEGPRATPAIADGRVYTFGAEGVLACWNLADGKKVWMIDTRKEYGTP